MKIKILEKKFTIVVILAIAYLNPFLTIDEGKNTSQYSVVEYIYYSTGNNKKM